MDREGLGRCALGRLEMNLSNIDKKTLVLAFAAVVAVPLYFVIPTILQFIVLFSIPWECDEGPYDNSGSVNTRGDVVIEYSKACTGVGTISDESVVLKLADRDQYITLVEHSDLPYPYPKLRWIDDDTISIDLGRVRSVWSKRDRFGRIKIVYTYSVTE